MRKRVFRIAALIGITLSVFVGALFLADHVANNEAARQLVERFGYFGVFIISFISGVNLIVPFPAATFVPVYTAAGFPLIALIPVMTAGTLVADTLGYLLGLGGRHITELKYPELQTRMQEFATQHRVFILPTVFLFAAAAPMPNEVLLIPLALVGIKYRTLIIPLALGTLIYHTVLAYGADSIFEYFF